jgi:hypothetical protein
MASDIELLYFGHPAAAQDTNLDHYFVSTSAFTTISDLSDQRCIIVGKKGCGKTALFNRLAESASESRLVTRISPHTHQIEASVGYSYRQYENLFQYEILLEVLKTFSKNAEVTRRFDKDFVLKAKTEAREYMQVFKGLKRKLVGIKEVQIFGCGVSSEDEKTSVLRLTSAQNAQKLKDLVSGILKEGIEILVLVDDPDLLFGEVERPVDIVGGLLLAGVDITSMGRKHPLQGRNVAKPSYIKICSLVKQHKYELLAWEFEDFDKIALNELPLKWTDTELDQLVVERIRFREGLPKSAGSLACWAKAFAVSTQKDADEFKTYLYPRLTNGPRDLITFCNMAKRAAIGTKKDLITLDTLLNVEGDYSKDCLQEVGREFNRPYPGIVSVVVKLFDHSVLKSSGKISKAAMADALSERYRSEEIQSEKKDKRWLAEAHGRLLVEILFKVGVIGFMSRRDPTLPVMSYSPGSVEDSLQNATAFFVHPAYRRALGI